VITIAPADDLTIVRELITEYALLAVQLPESKRAQILSCLTGGVLQLVSSERRSAARNEDDARAGFGPDRVPIHGQRLVPAEDVGRRGDVTSCELNGNSALFAVAVAVLAFLVICASLCRIRRP
jgi:hypothetical protein